MRIERVAPSQHIKGRVLVFLEGGECLKITEQELLDFDLRAGGGLAGLERERRRVRRAPVRRRRD